MCHVRNSLWHPCSWARAPGVSPAEVEGTEAHCLSGERVLAAPLGFLLLPSLLYSVSFSFLLSRSCTFSLCENPQAYIPCRVHRHEFLHTCARSHSSQLCVWIPVSHKLMEHGSPLIWKGFRCYWWLLCGIMLLFKFLCLFWIWVKLEFLTFIIEVSHFGHWLCISLTYFPTFSMIYRHSFYNLMWTWRVLC